MALSIDSNYHGNMNSALSIIATMISIIALVGVAVSLSLQNRQLRASQAQTSRELHLELLRMGVDNPAAVAAIDKNTSPADVPVYSLMNLQVTTWKVAYSLNEIERDVLAFQARRIFESGAPRRWWRIARESYRIDTATKRNREFFAIIDEASRSALRHLESND
jgi:hypothetical protein